jgi:hypothetical protein
VHRAQAGTLEIGDDNLGNGPVVIDHEHCRWDGL